MRQLVIAGAMLAMTPAAALADDMFRGMSPLAAEGGDGIVRFENIDPDVMRMEVGDRVTLNFGAGYEAELDRLGTQELGGQVWVGRIADMTIQNRVIMVQTNGYTFGQIQAPDGLYWVYPGASGHEILRIPDDAVELELVDDGLIVPMDQMLETADARGYAIGSPDISENVAVGANGTMDIIVFYSDSFVTRWGLATGGRIQYLMALLDQALIDSQTGLRARLVNAQSVSLTTETSALSQTLINFAGFVCCGVTSITQDLSALRAARTTYGADLAAILMRSQTGQSSCGVGFVNGGSDDDISAGDASGGYSVSADWIRDTDAPSGGFTFCSDATFAHEVGHNMGFAHNVEDASGVGQGVRPFAHGHRVDGSFRTIMAYNSSTGESRVNYFSNPDITLCPSGAACGIAAPGELSSSGIDSPATEDPADNARAAREESLNIVSWNAEIPRIVSSMLPITRSVQNGTAATAFVSVINPAATGSTATGCGLRLPGATAAQFSYQTTNASNALTGAANTTTDIAAGAVQNFVVSVTSATDFTDNINTPIGFSSGNNETELFIEAFCSNRRSAEYTLGLNSLIFRSTTAAPTDIIALAATIGNTGRVEVPTTGNMVGVFSVAITNNGVAGSVTVSADTGSQTLAITEIEICETNPSTGACTDARENTKTLTVGAGSTATFGIFVRGNGAAIANDPADNRVFVRFAVGGDPVGATSVAVRTP